MKPMMEKSGQALNIIIYAQSGVLAGDLAALLSGHHHVDLQTNLYGIINALTLKTDILLLVKDNQSIEPLDSTVVLKAAGKTNCKVIMLGDWKEITSEKYNNRVEILPRMPSPTVLLDIIKR